MLKITDIYKSKIAVLTDSILTGFDRYCILGNKSKSSEIVKFTAWLAGAWADSVPDIPEAYDDVMSVCRDLGFEDSMPRLLDTILSDGNDEALKELCRVLEKYPEILEEIKKVKRP